MGVSSLPRRVLLINRCFVKWTLLVQLNRRLFQRLRHSWRREKVSMNHKALEAFDRICSAAVLIHSQEAHEAFAADKQVVIDALTAQPIEDMNALSRLLSTLDRL